MDVTCALWLYGYCLAVSQSSRKGLKAMRDWAFHEARGSQFHILMADGKKNIYRCLFLHVFFRETAL